MCVLHATARARVCVTTCTGPRYFKRSASLVIAHEHRQKGVDVSRHCHRERPNAEHRGELGRRRRAGRWGWQGGRLRRRRRARNPHERRMEAEPSKVAPRGVATLAVRQAHVVAEADTHLNPVLAIIDLFRVTIVYRFGVPHALDAWNAWDCDCHPLVNPERAVRAIRLDAV